MLGNVSQARTETGRKLDGLWDYLRCYEQYHKQKLGEGLRRFLQTIETEGSLLTDLS